MNANSDRLRPSSTSLALASLGVHPCRLAIRLRRFPLSAGKRMLTTMERGFRIGFPPVVTVVSIVAHCDCGHSCPTHVAYTWPRYCRPHGMNSGGASYLTWAPKRDSRSRSAHRRRRHCRPALVFHLSRRCAISLYAPDRSFRQRINLRVSGGFVRQFASPANRYSRAIRIEPLPNRHALPSPLSFSSRPILSWESTRTSATPASRAASSALFLAFSATERFESVRWSRKPSSSGCVLNHSSSTAIVSRYG